MSNPTPVVYWRTPDGSDNSWVYKYLKDKLPVTPNTFLTIVVSMPDIFPEKPIEITFE
jgi:hypothetical protein